MRVQQKSIDVGVGIIDADFHGELGVVLFAFGSEDFAKDGRQGSIDHLKKYSCYSGDR